MNANVGEIETWHMAHGLTQAHNFKHQIDLFWTHYRPILKRKNGIKTTIPPCTEVTRVIIIAQKLHLNALTLWHCKSVFERHSKP